MTIPTTFFTTYHDLFVTLHLFAMVVGLGGATYTDLLLIRFLKDLKISHKEADIIRFMSKMIFLGVLLALLSGLALFLEKPEVLLQTPKFLAKVVAFTIIVLNGTLLHIVVLPKLLHFSFKKEHFLYKNILHLRKLGFIMGAISATSWYMVFLMGSFSRIPFSLPTLLSLYFGTMGIGILCALTLEHTIHRVTTKKEKQL